MLICYHKIMSLSSGDLNPVRVTSRQKRTTKVLTGGVDLIDKGLTIKVRDKKGTYYILK